MRIKNNELKDLFVWDVVKLNELFETLIWFK